MENKKSKKGNKLFLGLIGIMLLGMIGACSGETESNMVDRNMPVLEEMSESDWGMVEQEMEEVLEKVASAVEEAPEPTEEPAPEPTGTPLLTIEPTATPKPTPTPTPAPTSTPVPTPEPTSTPKPTPVLTSEQTAEPMIERAPVPEGIDYILNTNTKKFHYTGCSSVKQMKEKNKKYYTGTREECIGMGYDPCGRCEP